MPFVRKSAFNGKASSALSDRARRDHAQWLAE
jgi:hypothetical protein